MSDALAVMAPENVPDELVEIGLRALYGDAPVDWSDRNDMRQVLAAVLPVYGAGIIANAGVEHYDRQVDLARSLTTRVYSAALLLHIAAEATQKANAGIDTALNLKLAETLRERAHQEGAP